jgi:hypothetical protein
MQVQGFVFVSLNLLNFNEKMFHFKRYNDTFRLNARILYTFNDNQQRLVLTEKAVTYVRQREFINNERQLRAGHNACVRVFTFKQVVYHCNLRPADFYALNGATPNTRSAAVKLEVDMFAVSSFSCRQKK